MVIGLAGGIGAGKSTVARILGEHGAAVIVSDRLNHQELDSPEVIQTLVEWFGPGLLGADGEILRPALAEIVFSDPQHRARVEGLLHPRIDRRRRELIASYGRDPQIRLIVIDSPLLFETGLNESCDAVVFVEASIDDRRRRLAAERGWSAGDLRGREKLQKPLDSKRFDADHIVVNNSGLDDLRAEVERLLSKLRV